MALIVFVSSMVAFVHQRRKDRVSSLVSILVLAGLIIPPAVVPTIFVLQALGLFKTLTGLILIHLAFAMPFAVIVLRAFVGSIPREIDEAAIVDGASPMTLFFRVIFPLIRPAVITVIVVNAVLIYNDFVNAALLPARRRERHRPAHAVQLPEPVPHPVEPALHGRGADHHPAPDHVHLLQPEDRLRLGRRRGQGLSPREPNCRRRP